MAEERQPFVPPGWWSGKDFYPVPGYTGKSVNLPIDVRGGFQWLDHRVGDGCDPYPCFEIHDTAQEWDIQDGYVDDEGQEWAILTTAISVPVEALEQMQEYMFDTEQEDTEKGDANG